MKSLIDIIDIVFSNLLKCYLICHVQKMPQNGLKKTNNKYMQGENALSLLKTEFKLKLWRKQAYWRYIL